MVAPTLTFEDDFSSDKSWVESGSQFTIDTSTNNRIDFVLKRDGADHVVYKDLTSVSDTAWVLRMHLDFTGNTSADTYDSQTFFGLSSTNGAYSGTQDAIGLEIRWGIDDDFKTGSANGSLLPFVNTSTFSTPFTSTDEYWVEIIRVSSTSFTIELFSDSTYTTSVEKVTETTSSGVSGLQYIVGKMRNGSIRAELQNGWLDDVKFYNGVTSAEPIPPTNTKLLKLNDVEFSVGTTTASVIGLTTTNQVISNWDGSSSLGGGGGGISKVGTGIGYAKIYDASGTLLATSTNGKDFTDMAGEAQSVHHTTTFNFATPILMGVNYYVTFEAGSGASYGNGNEVNLIASNVAGDALNNFGYYGNNGQNSWTWNTARTLGLEYSYSSPLISAGGSEVIVGATGNSNAAIDYATHKYISGLTPGDTIESVTLDVYNAATNIKVGVYTTTGSGTSTSPDSLLAQGVGAVSVLNTYTTVTIPLTTTATVPSNGIVWVGMFPEASVNFRQTTSSGDYTNSKHGSGVSGATYANAMPSTAWVGTGGDGGNGGYNVRFGVVTAGLTDNTSTPQHYAFTRDSSNLWTIYQNGVSKATATDATSLGSNTLMIPTATHTQSQVNDWGAGAGGGKGTTGQYIATTNSVLYNQPIYEVSLWCYATGSPTGDFRIGVWNDGGLSAGGTDVGTLVHTFGIIDASTVTGTSSNPVKLTATGTTTYLPQVTDLIGYYQTSGFTDSSNTISCGQQNTQVFDSSDSHLTEGFNSNTVFQTRDHTIEFKIGSPPDYTTNLSGTLDEFFINSDTLTSTEVAAISARGIDSWAIL